MEIVSNTTLDLRANNVGFQRLFAENIFRYIRYVNADLSIHMFRFMNPSSDHSFVLPYHCTLICNDKVTDFVASYVWRGFKLF